MAFFSSPKISLIGKVACFSVFFFLLIAPFAIAADTTAPTNASTAQVQNASATTQPQDESKGWLASKIDTFVGLTKFFSVQGILSLIQNVVFVTTNMILGNLVNISAWLFEMALNLVMSSDMTIVQTGWAVSLSVANSLFLLIFLGIAIATILGLSDFGYKKMLPNFMMVAVLINFSLVIGMSIISLSNALTMSFYKAISQAPTSAAQQATQETIAYYSGTNPAVANIMNRLNSAEPKKVMDDPETGVVAKLAESSQKGADPTVDSFGDLLAMMFFKIFTYLILIFVFLAGAVYMISRTFMLWFLLMIAPLAWIAYTIPHPTIKKKWGEWWRKFMSWNIFAPAYLFFVFLGLKLAEATPNFGATPKFAGIDPTIVIKTLMVGFVMLAGLSVSSKLGVGGSNFVINWGKKQVGDFKRTMSNLRSQTKVGKYINEFGERAAKKTALGISRVPGAGWATGYTAKGVGEKLEKERLAKQKERLEPKIAAEKAKIETLHHLEAFAQYQSAIAKGDASAGTAALAQLVKDQQKLIAIEFENARAAGRKTITTASGQIAVPATKQDQKNQATTLNENIRRTTQNTIAGNQSGVTYL